MPQYRVTLDNGKVLTVESDHPPTEDEINDSYGQWQKEQQQPSRTRRPRVEAPDPELAEPHENKTSFLGTAAREAALGIIPTWAAKEAAEGAMGLLAPTLNPWAMGAGAIVAGGTVGGLADYGEEKLLKATVPDFMKEVEAGREEHPRAAALGRFGVGLGLFRPDYKTIPNALRSLKYWRTGTEAQRKLVTNAARNLAIGAASGVAIPALHGHLPTAEDVITGAAQGALYGRPYDWTRRVSPGSAYLRSRLGGLVQPPTEGPPDASGQQEATTVHEPVPAPTGQSTGQVPTAPSGERVRPVTPPVGQETQVPLAAEPTPKKPPAPPKITRTAQFGFRVEYDGRWEEGFPTHESAEAALHEHQAERRPLKYEDGQAMPREEIEKNRAEAQERKEQYISDEEAEHRDALDADTSEAVPPGHTVTPGTTDENVPFGWSRMGKTHFLEALGGKRIAINRDELRQWVSDRYQEGFSREEMREMIKARMDEEVEHGKFIDAAGGMAKANALAERFWDTLTFAEKRVVSRKYLGKWGRGDRTKSAMGHEAIRMIRQRARGAPEGDILETMALENLGLKGISVLSETLRRFREKVGTKAAREGQAILDATQEKAGDPTTEPTSGGPGATKQDRETQDKIDYLSGKSAKFRDEAKGKEPGDAKHLTDAADLMDREAARLKTLLPPTIGPKPGSERKTRIREEQVNTLTGKYNTRVQEEEVAPGVWVDKSIAPTIRSLNESGYETEYSHSGVSGEHFRDIGKDADQGYIYFQKLSPEKTKKLIGAARSSGFTVMRLDEGRIRVGIPGSHELRGNVGGNQSMHPDGLRVKMFDDLASKLRSGFPGSIRKIPERDLLVEHGMLPYKGWMRPDGRILIVDSLHGSTASLLTGKEPFDAIAHLVSNGYLRIYKDLWGLHVLMGKPSEKQLGELRSLATESQLKLLDFNGQEHPGAKRKPRGFGSMPFDLIVPVWSQLRDNGVDVGKEPTGENVTKSIEWLATHNQEDWPASKAVKDQLQAWFRNNKGGGWDRERLIEEEISRLNEERDAASERGEKAPASVITRQLYLDFLLADLEQNERRGIEDYRPASPRKRSEKDEPMLFGNLQKSGEQREPGKMVVPVKPEERKAEVPPLTEEQMRAAQRPLPGEDALRAVVHPQIKAQAPTYDAFYDALEKAFGKSAAEELGGDLFEDLTWKELMSATPERLAQLISSYRLGPKIGIKKLPRMREEDIARINDPKARQEARAQAELFKGKQPELSGGEVEKLVNRIRGSKSFRSTVMSTIARDMFKDMLKAEEASYRKKSVEFEDIDLDNPKGKPAGYHEFTPGESNSPKLLSEILSNRGRAGSRAPVSASYRLVALRNRINGKVELVSAYDDGRRGVVVYRPGRNMYVPLAEVDPNLKFFATLLLNEPLQQHEQYFKNTDEFQRHFDSKNAERLSKGAVVPGTQKQAVALRPGEGTEGRESLERLLMAGVEGQEGKEGVGTRALTSREALGKFAGTSGVQGPESDLIAAMRGLGAGELEKAVSGDAPLTGPEASSLHKVLGEMDVTEPEDMKEMLYLLDGMAQRGRLEGRHYQAYAALYKLAGAIQRAAAAEAVETTHPLPADRLPITPERLHDATLQAAFELFKTHKDREAFTLDALLNFGWEPSRLGEPVSKAPVPHGEAEGETLTMLKRRPPTDVAGLPPGEPREMTTANPGIIPGPETLAPEAQAALENYAQAYQPTTQLGGPPTGPGEYGGAKFKGEVPKGVPKEMPHEAAVPVETARMGKFKYGPPEFIIKTRPYPRPKTGQQMLEPPGYLMGPQKGRTPEGGPGAVNRRIQEVYDTLSILRRNIGTAVGRGLTKKDIAGHADGVHRLSENYSIKNGESIRWQSIPDDAKATKAEKSMWRTMAERPEAVRVRKAVVPWNAALSIRNDAVRAEVYQAWERLKKKEAQEKKDRIAAAQETGDEAAIEKAKDEHPSIYRDPADEPRYVRPTRPLPEDFDPLILKANKGIYNAQDAMRSENPVLRRMGKKALAGAQELKELAIWAKHNLDHPELERTAQQFRDVMDGHLQLMLTEGSNIAARDFYVPDRFGAGEWDDGMMAWGEQRYLGTNYRLPRVFTDYYDAIAAKDKKGRMYYPVNLDVADLAQHSLVRGMRRLAWQDWANILLATKDPSSPGGKETVAVAADLIPVHKMVRNAAGVMEQQTVLEPQVPSGKQEYELVRIGGPKGTAIAVREGYKPLVEMMMEESRVPNMPGGKAALATAHALKHGFILLGDTFHLGRLWQYATALGGKAWFEVTGRPGWKSGYSALTWHPEDIQRAVKAGLITEKAAKWALEPVKMYDGGVIRTMTRHEIAGIYLSVGLNANRSADFMYRNAVKAMPVIGDWWYQHLVDKPTKFLFDRYTPGLIVEMAVRNLERQNPGDRKTPLLRQMRYIARDTNAFFGNMGRQGFFKNPTFRDLSQFAVLAPLWQEGLLRKEFTAAYRLATGVKYLKGGQSRSFEAHLGPITFGVMRGLGMYFILTQALNLMTKRHFTWQNEEEGHKMDAWLPNGFGAGIWISPMSVFAETAHEFIRLYQTKSTAMETAARLGLNKAGPLGRMANVLWTQQTPGGEHTTSTADTLWAAGSELAPLPISVGAGVKELAYQAGAGRILPGVVPSKPGSALQRGMAMVGVKSELGRRAEDDIARLADKFLISEGLKYQPLQMVPTTDPTYAKLRGAIKNKDFGGAKRILNGLRQHRTDEQIVHAMKLASTRPFTGSHKAENLFLYSLTDYQQDLYSKAQENRSAIYQDFLEFLTNN